MASISNLSVILSANTDPLGKALKKAERDVAAFKMQSSLGESVKTGFGIGLGVLGLDKIEMAMKKAIKTMPELQAAADTVEQAFGKAFIHLTMMDQWLPKLAAEVKNFSSRVEEGFVGQEIKEWGTFLYHGLVYGTKSAYAAAEASRNAFINAKLAEAAERRKLDIMYQQTIESSKQLREQVGGTELQDKLYEQMVQKRNALNPDFDKEQMQLALQEAPDSAKAMLIKDAQKDIEAYEQKKKLMEQEKQNRSEIESMMKTAQDGLYQQMYDEVELQVARLETLGATVEEMRKYRDLVEETKYLAAEKVFWQAADEEMTRQLQDEQDRIAKAQADWQSKQGQAQFAGGLSGSAAYSAIVNASNQTEDHILQKKQVEIGKEQVKETKEVGQKIYDATKVFAENKLAIKVITFGGM